MKFLVIICMHSVIKHVDFKGNGKESIPDSIQNYGWCCFGLLFYDTKETSSRRIHTFQRIDALVQIWCYCLHFHMAGGLSTPCISWFFCGMFPLVFTTQTLSLLYESIFPSLHSICHRGCSFHCSDHSAISWAATIMTISSFSVFPHFVIMNIKLPIATPFPENMLLLSDTYKRLLLLQGHYWFLKWSEGNFPQFFWEIIDLYIPLHTFKAYGMMIWFAYIVKWCLQQDRRISNISCRCNIKKRK